MQLSKGSVMGAQTSAVLRPALGQEFALAVEWAEGALEVAEDSGDVGMELLVEDFQGS